MLLIVVLTLSFLAAGAGRGYLAGVGLGDSTDEVLAHVCPGPDACYYLTGGKELLETGSISPPNYWILNLWPPGVVVVSALYILIANSGLPLPVVAGAIGIMAWTVVLSLWYRYLRARVGIGLSISAVLMVALGQPMRDWYLADGLFYVESLSVVLFLGALLSLMPRGSESARIQLRRGTMAGCLLAAAAYLRVAFELVGLTLSVITVAGFVWGFRSFLRGGTSLKVRLVRMATAGRTLLVCVIAFHALTVPWRFIASETVRPEESLGWSMGADVLIPQLWMPSDYLRGYGLEWLVDGTANTPCRVDPEKCSQYYQAEVASDGAYTGLVTPLGEFQSAAIDAWRGNPIEWTVIKTDGALRFWFSYAADPGSFEFHESGILLLLLLLVARFGHKATGPAFFLVVALAIATMGPAYVFHYEVRYFFPIKSALPLVGAMCVPRGLRRLRGELGSRSLVGMPD